MGPAFRIDYFVNYISVVENLRFIQHKKKTLNKLKILKIFEEWLLGDKLDQKSRRDVRVHRRSLRLVSRPQTFLVNFNLNFKNICFVG